MSRENVERTRQAVEALQGDDVDEFLTYVDPNVEWQSFLREAFHGHDGVRQWWRGFRASFPDFALSILDIRDLGDWIVIHGSVQGSGAGSGVDIQTDFWQAIQVREGRLARYAVFETEAEALEAVGLRE